MGFECFFAADFLLCERNPVIFAVLYRNIIIPVKQGKKQGSQTENQDQFSSRYSDTKTDYCSLFKCVQYNDELQNKYKFLYSQPVSDVV